MTGSSTRISFESLRESRPQALVIGGSVGGLLATHLLRQAGWQASVFERTAGDLGDRGTGIGTRAELFGVMRRIGLATGASIGVAVRGRIGLERSGSIVHELPVRAVTSAWARIWRPLRAALPEGCYCGGSTLTRVEQDGASVTAVFADGSRAQGDLLIAADGLHSAVRGQFVPDAKPRYAGYVAWRGVVEERQLDPALAPLMFHHMVFGFPDGELMLSLPMPGPDAGARRCHFVWFRPASASALTELCTDASGKRHGVAIPPPLIRPELIAALKTEAEARLAPQLSALVRATSQIILQPIFDLASPRLVFGRVALLGDAAFVARPHVASGVMKAALDAERLADALTASGGDVAAALGRYEAERKPYGEWLVERGRHIGATITARELEPRQRVETLMREYGAAGLVGGAPIAARIPE